MSNTTATATALRPLTAFEEEELDQKMKSILLLIQAKYNELADAQRRRAYRLQQPIPLSRLRSELNTLENCYEEVIAEKERRTI